MDSSRSLLYPENSAYEPQGENFFSSFFSRLKKIISGPKVIAVKNSKSKYQSGQTFLVGKKEYVHYADLHPRDTALFVMFNKHKALMLGFAVVLGAAFFINWHAVIVFILSLVILIYFIDSLFNLFLAYRSFSKPVEIKISQQEMGQVAESDWPTYTIFCPLYKEAGVVPQFVTAMKKLDYPTEKLQILFLLEEDDKETVEKIKKTNLPENFEIAVVPHSLPKTKPKALNYGLRLARGRYTVIFDAEDQPDPTQLKKAVLAFAKSGSGTVCVQAKLNFYNSGQNLLTKIFTAEYSLWFDVVLPGLQSVNAPIPLGGTSNHFRTMDLKKLQGWDAFNVTEDCDLGIRLSRKGYKTAIFDSTTWEEANSEFRNWYNQRSRWIKGYIQTFFVHTRHWRSFLESDRPQDLWFFIATVAGKIASIFINPVMWAMTLAYFLFRPTIGPFIESFFPAPLLYMGVFSFIFGNFFYWYLYMVGTAKREFDGLIKYIFVVPFYWLAMSLSAWKALYELMVKPHFWAKTVHGLHLQEQKKEGKLWDFVLRPAQKVAALARSQSLLSASGFLVGAVIISNFLNFLFNALLGRSLGLEDFGVLTLFNTISLFFTIFTSALSSTVTHKVAFVSGSEGIVAGNSFQSGVRSVSLKAALATCLAWIVVVPVMMSFFNVTGLSLAFLYTPVLALGILIAVDKGYMQGMMKFVYVGIAILVETVVKLVSAVVLIELGLKSWVVASLPVSLGFAFVVTWLLAKRTRVLSLSVPAVTSKSLPEPVRFPYWFFTAAALTGLSTIVFISLDVVLAKHFFSPVMAGQYSLLSLAGKMIFYSGSLSSMFIITFTSRDEGMNINPTPMFYRLLNWTVFLAGTAWAVLNGFSKALVPFLFGAKAVEILPYLAVYSAAMALFTVANAFVIHHLARRQFVFSIVAILVNILMAVGLWSHHATIMDIVNVLLATSVGYLGLVVVLHLLQRNGKFIVRNLIDLVDVFFPLAPAEAVAGRKRILIFNWRDTKHTFAGGAEVYVHELAKRWTQDGNHVTVFCGNDGNCPRQEIVDGVRVVRRGGFYFVYLWAFVYYMLQFRGRFDLIIDSQNGVPFFTPLYAKEEVVCLLHHVHQEVFRKYLKGPLARLAAVLENRVMPWAYRKTKFITISNSSKQSMEELGLGLSGVKIVHPGVDLSFLRPGKKSGQPLVLYLGRLKAYKSVDVLIRAFKNVSSKLPQARLVIAGSGEEEENLKRLARFLQLDRYISFLGKVTEEQKLKLLQSAWVLVNPSMVEGWGITTIEANACGVPVVAANVPGLRDSVSNPHTGYLVTHGDVEGFGEKITLLLKDSSLRSRMSRQAVLWAKNYDWRRISQWGFKALFNS